MGIDTREQPAFTIDQREGTVTGPGGTIRLEPRVMEVLAILAKHPGRVVSRGEFLDAVWPDVVVTEHTLSRCVYQLRQALEKIAGERGDDRFVPIETLPKRGYRLLARIETQSAQVRSTTLEYAPGPVRIPFVVGQWVRGDRFYGRTAQIAEILDGPRDCIWLLGTRRIGKTSLLKQIEYIASTSEEQRYLPIFWDFQGAETPAEFHLNFADALVDADEQLAQIGIRLDEVAAEDLFVSIERLRRRLRAGRRRLLLLCDEVEQLIVLNRDAPSLLRKLRHTMQSREDIRTVLASTIRLWALADQNADTSPLLHGFTPPLYIERLTDDEARLLIRQSHLDPERRPRIPDDVAEAIRSHCDNHPYLVQLVCKRFLESGRLDEAVEQVATDRMVSYFFAIDFDMLSDVDRSVVRFMAGQPGVPGDGIGDELALETDRLEGTLRRLENLGFVRRDGNNGFVLANAFFRRWLQQSQPTVDTSAGVVAGGEAAESAQPAPEPAGEGAALGLFAEMKRRSVVRVGIAYVAVAWVLLQLGDVVFDFLDVPDWAGKLLIAFLALGLPVALILAWAFELTPEGVKREADVDRTQATPGRFARNFDFVVIFVLVIAVAFFILERFL